jgi:hypothetical protein
MGCNSNTSILIRDIQRSIKEEGGGGNGTMEAEGGEMQPLAYECLKLPIAGKGKVLTLLGGAVLEFELRTLHLLRSSTTFEPCLQP